MADEVLRERRGHVEILTINRPEARNAINRATAAALGDALDDCETDNDVWVVVLTAAGDKAFSAGMDLKAFAAGEFPVTDKGFGASPNVTSPNRSSRRPTARRSPAASRS
jgi:enoyl-CoA hydratase/carnithine racemase